MRKLLSCILALCMAFSLLTVNNVHATKQSHYEGVFVDEEGIGEEESCNVSYNSSLNQTSVTGLYKDQMNSGLEAYVYQALENTELSSTTNGVSIEYVYANGETKEIVENTFDYNKVLLGYQRDHIDEFNWQNRNGVSLKNPTYGDTSCSLTVYYPVSSYYDPSMETQVDEVIQQGLQTVTGTTRYEQLQQIYQWIISYGEYDYDALYSSATDEDRYYAHTQMGILLRKKGVCESYAKTFKMFCLQLNIPCLIVTSNNHAWNYVLMEDGKWYMVDATYGDGGIGAAPYYFLVPNLPYIDTSHIHDSKFNYPYTDYVSYSTWINHQPVITINQQVSCTQEGKVVITCDHCSTLYENYTIDPLGHYEVIKSFNRDANGGTVIVYECQRCGEQRVVTNNTCENHDWENQGTKFSNDFSLATVTYVCSYCGKTESFSAPTTVSYSTEPTCTTSGYGTYTAKVPCVLTRVEDGTTYTTTLTVTSRKSTTIPALGHDYIEEVVAPTTTNQGYTLHTCSRCNDQYKDHYTDPIAAEAVKFNSVSLILSGQIALNFYVTLTDEAKTDDAYMHFVVNQRTVDVPLSEASIDSKGRYAFKIGVSSIEMADTVTATYYYNHTPSKSIDYSVKKYIDAVIANSSLFDQKVIDLVKAISDYGYYAQQYFSSAKGWTIGVEHQAMNKYYNYTSATLDAFQVSVPANTTGMSVATYSLDLESETIIKVYIKKGTYSGTPVFKVNGKEVTATYDASKDRYCVNVTNISAHLLGDDYTITLDGQTLFTGSALSYARAVINSSSYTDEFKELIYALYNYYQENLNYRS